MNPERVRSEISNPFGVDVVVGVFHPGRRGEAPLALG
jgi:hypothetical protein